MRLSLFLQLLTAVGLAASLFSEGKAPLFLPPAPSTGAYPTWLTCLKLFAVPLCLGTLNLTKSRLAVWAIRGWSALLSVLTAMALWEVWQLGLRFEAALFMAVVLILSLSTCLYSFLGPELARLRQQRNL